MKIWKFAAVAALAMIGFTGMSLAPVSVGLTQQAYAELPALTGGYTLDGGTGICLWIHPDDCECGCLGTRVDFFNGEEDEGPVFTMIDTGVDYVWETPLKKDANGYWTCYRLSIAWCPITGGWIYTLEFWVHTYTGWVHRPVDSGTATKNPG